VVAQFSNGTCIAGIVEVQEDIFYVPSAQGSVYHFDFLPNTTVVWEVDMRCYKKGGQASVRKVAEIPEAGLLNGMVLLSRGEGTILMADSALGVVWKLNFYTGAYEIVFDHPVLKPVKGAAVEFGVNGVHVVDSVLYFTNTDLGLLGKVHISTDGFPIDSPVNITTSVPAADDFAIDSSVNFWVAENVANTFVRVSSDGVVQIIAGGANSSDLIGPVGAVFDRGIHDHDTLYISIDGLSESDTGVLLTTNGKIVQIDTKN
jgi:hypothetical protein